MGFELVVVAELIGLWAICGLFLRGRSWAIVRRWQQDWVATMHALGLHPDGAPPTGVPEPLADARVTLRVRPARTVVDTAIIARVEHPRLDPAIGLRVHPGDPRAKGVLYPEARWTGDPVFDGTFVVENAGPADAVRLSAPARARLIDHLAHDALVLRDGAFEVTSSPADPGGGGRSSLDTLARAARELTAWSATPTDWQGFVATALCDDAAPIRRLARSHLAALDSAPDWTRALPEATVDRANLLGALLASNDLDLRTRRFIAAFPAYTQHHAHEPARSC